MYNNAARGRGIAMKQDPESLERDNDIAIDHMGDRVAMLRKITSGIHDEAESHHRLLDEIGGSMGGVGANLQQTLAHFNKVFVENKNGRQFCFMVGGITFVVFLLFQLGLR